MSNVDASRTPWRLEPTLVARPWGGRRLVELPHAGAAPAGPIGEAWLAGPDTLAVSAQAPDAHRSAARTTLAALAAAAGEAFVGHAAFRRHGARVPLLVKLLDAAEALSVQVHPDDAYARAHARRGASGEPALGKTEAWLILDAAPSATVAWGWRRAVGADEVRRAIEAGTMETLLRDHPVAAGDVVVNEAGVVHAVGPGILLYELQQASDLTYRLFDYDRRDAAGRPRDLHLDEALDVARFEPNDDAVAPRPLGQGRWLLAETHAFRMERWGLGRDGAPSEQAWRVDPRSMELWTVLDGAATLAWDGGRCHLERFESVALPAALGAARWTGDATLVRGSV